MTAAPAAAVLAAARQLRAAGVENPRREARLLLELATGRSVGVVTDASLGDAEWAGFQALVERRARREPMAYLRGRVGFWDLDLAVGPGVLIPRPETETLIEASLAEYSDRASPLRVLDLGTGSGCLALTLAHLFPSARAVALDSAPEAIACCAANARRLGLGGRLDLVLGGWADAPNGPFDLVVSNPPYVSTAEYRLLQPEVLAYEPETALLAGEDGLAAYRLLVPEAARRLDRQGRLILEIGRGQAAAVRRIVEAHGCSAERTLRDLAGIERCIVARRWGDSGER